MVDFWASGYDNWDADEQRLFDVMAETVGSDALYDDVMLQTFIDVLYNGDPGTLPVGDFHRDIHNALVEYVHDQYGFDFDEIWDWEAWREAYGND